MTTASEASSYDLTPAEALALLDGEHTDARLALKLTLLDLMADGLLLLLPDSLPVSSAHLVTARATPATNNPYVLSPVAGRAPERLQHRAAAVSALALASPPGVNGSFRQSRQLLRAEFGSDVSGFVPYLQQDLIQRGLLSHEPLPGSRTGWFASLIAQREPYITSAGAAAQVLWRDRREAACLLAQDLHDQKDSAARREDLTGVALFAERADTTVLFLDNAFHPMDYRLIRRALIERAGIPAAARLPRLLALAEHHGRRLTRGLSFLDDGIDQILPRGGIR